MTTVYFVRHAEPNYHNHEDAYRELTPKGLEDRTRVTAFLKDKGVNAVLSSPYKRAVQTVEHFARTYGFSIVKIPDFRERKVESGWIEDFDDFCRNQWENFDYKLSDGESLREVQNRNISALKSVLTEYRDQTVVIGSHGTALSTIINFYDASFDYESFQRIRKRMPWVVMFRFEGMRCVQVRECDLLDI